VKGTGLGLSLSYDIIKSTWRRNKSETNEGEGKGIYYSITFKKCNYLITIIKNYGGINPKHRAFII